MKKILQIVLSLIFSLCLICGTVATVSAASVGKVKKLEAVTAPTSVTLTWTKPSGAKGYKVQQYIKKKWKTVKTINKAKTTTAKITGLKSKKTYKFRVAAKGSKGYGAYVTITVKTVPPTVEGVKATPSLQTASIKWTKAAGVTGYKVEYSTDKKFSKSKTKTATVKKSSTVKTTLKKLSPNKTYYVRVRAYTNLNGTVHYGAYSKSVSFKTAYKTAVSGLKVKSATYNSAALAWSKASGASGYQIQYSTDKKFSKSKTNSVTVKKESSVKTTLKKLSVNKTYYVRIRAYKTVKDKSYYGPYSKAVSFKTAYNTAVSNLKVKAASHNSVTLTWKKLSDVSGYQIERKSGKKWVSVKSVSKSTASYKITKLNAVTSYTFRVRAFNKISGKTYTGPWKEIKAATGIGPVNKLSFSSLTATSVKLKWEAAAGAKGYYIMNNGSKISTVSTNSATLKIKAGTAYKITVVAYNGSKTGKASSEITFTSPCASVKGLKVTKASDTSITYSWSKSAGAKSYEVQYRKNGGSWSSVASTTSTSYTISKLSPATTYELRVRALSKNGSETQRTDYCSAVSARTYGLIADITDGAKVKLSWGTVPGAKNYSVQRCDTSTYGWKTVKTTTSTSYEEKIPSAINYRVVAKDSSGKTLYTAENLTVNASGVKFVVEGNRVTVSWSKVSKATGYQVRRSTSEYWVDTDPFGTSTFKTEYMIAPGLTHNFKVYSILASGEKVIGSVNIAAPAMDVSDTSAESKNAQLHYLAEAINRSKFDNSKNTTIDISGKSENEITYISLGGSGATLIKLFLMGSGYTTKNGELVWDTPERIDKFIEFMNEGDDSSSDMERKTTSSLMRTYTKKKNNTLGTLIESNGSQIPLPMEQVFEPSGSGKYVAEIYNGLDSEAVAKAFDVKTTKKSYGYKVVVTIKQESKPVYHSGLLSGVVDNVAALSEESEALNATITVGDTILEAEIDNNCQLRNYKISSPYTAAAGLSADDVQTEDAGMISLSFVTKFTGLIEYEYKFTRS